MQRSSLEETMTSYDSADELLNSNMDSCACFEVKNSVFTPLCKLKTASHVMTISLDGMEDNDDPTVCTLCPQRYIKPQKLIQSIVNVTNDAQILVDRHQSTDRRRSLPALSGELQTWDQELSDELQICCSILSKNINEILDHKMDLEMGLARLKCHIDKGEDCTLARKPCSVERIKKMREEIIEHLKASFIFLIRHQESHHQKPIHADSGFADTPRSSTNTERSQPAFQFSGSGVGVEETLLQDLGDREETVPKCSDA